MIIKLLKFNANLKLFIKSLFLKIKKIINIIIIFFANRNIQIYTDKNAIKKLNHNKHLKLFEMQLSLE